MQSNQNNKAVIYCRVSTKDQVEEGNSLNTQERICRDYCLKNGYDVAQIFLEQGESAKTSDRTELRKLLNFCTDRRSQVKVVVIYKLDRLSRNTDDYSQIRLLLKKYQVEIKSTSEHFENTPVGRFMENTIANVAQFDNDIRAERCAGGMKEAVREGRYVWKAPIGYDNVRLSGKSTIAPNAVIAPLIKEAFREIGRNTRTIEEVRNLTNKQGLTSLAGRPISKTYFYRLLQNPLYAGWIVKFGGRYKGAFEPLVSEELFQTVQHVLKGKGTKHLQHRTDHPDFPLRRFVVDSSGRKLTGSWSQGRHRKFPYYRFGGKNSNHNRDELEEVFMEYMDRYAFDAENFEKLARFVCDHLKKAMIERQQTSDKLRKCIKELKERQTALIRKNLAGILSDSVLRTQLEEIEKEMAEANSTLLAMPEDMTDFDGVLDLVAEYVQKPSSVWRSASLEVKLQLQWFEFPLGLVFENGTFRTTELSFLFNEKETFSASFSPKVDPSGFEPLTSSVQMRRSTN